MDRLSRRDFVQLSSRAFLASASSKLLTANPQAPSVTSGDGKIKIKGLNYSWEYAQSDDTFRLRDSRNRLIVNGKIQPAIVVAPAEQPALRVCTPGKAAAPRVESGRVTFSYEGVNGSARLSVPWRFDEHGIWMEPVVYETQAAQDVVSLHYFVSNDGTNRTPALHATYLVVPGIVEGSGISPIVRDMEGLNQSVWLGRGGPAVGPLQQWALPVHYFCGFSVGPVDAQAARNALTEGRSDAFTCGLADLPAGDLFLQLSAGNSSPWIDYRSDLWKHLRGPGRLPLGANFFWAVGPDYYQAIAGYYLGLLQAGIIRKKQDSPRKAAACLTPQFCTWGSQVMRGKTDKNMDESFLTGIYEEMKASGMKAGMFSIDDKWEGIYGKLEHDAARLPHFEQFLDRVRSDGYRIGMWAAIMRCERPSDLGLTLDHVLKKPDGSPYKIVGASDYYILDFTQPEVAKVLDGVVRRFVRRYKPDLFKFDFGYELPPVGVAAPRDKQYSGERLMAKGLDVVIRAMREENPDLAVMYYNLSPLFLDYFDLHSPDDLFEDTGDYDVEANRRFYFSSLMGTLGVPTYGSSGYDWASAPNIWFDSAAVGTVGSLNDFRGDEEGEVSSPELIAKYNGIASVLRPTCTFEILPIDTVSQAPTLGAHARSWARFESGQLVLLAWRPPVPGEENPLMQTKAVDARVTDAVHSRVPVVVASKTAESIARSSQLAIAPYGSGEISILRKQGEKKPRY